MLTLQLFLRNVAGKTHYVVNCAVIHTHMSSDYLDQATMNAGCDTGLCTINLIICTKGNW